METILMIIGAFILIILVTLSALFSFSEMAISSSNKARLASIAKESKSKKEKKQANRVIHFVENYNEHITAIVIFNNIVNILFSTLATIYFVSVTGNSGTGALVSFLVTTPIVIIFGEIVPKQLAKRYPEKGTMKLSWSLQIVNFIMKPLTFLLSKIVKEQQSSMLGSDREIELALKEATKQGVTTSFEEQLIRRSLEIDNKKLSDVLIPIKDVAVIEGNVTKTKVDSILKKYPHSRFPVIKDGEVKSIFSAKKYLIDGLKGSKGDWEEYQFEFATLDHDDNPYHAFELLRNRRERVAIVVNEEEELIGIVTIEDIIELMLGNIYDETDHEADGVYSLSNTSVIVEPKVKVAYIKENYIKDLKLEKEELNLTMKQFVTKISGKRRVKVGEHFTHKNLIIWVNNDNNDESKIIYEIDIV